MYFRNLEYQIEIIPNFLKSVIPFPKLKGNYNVLKEKKNNFLLHPQTNCCKHQSYKLINWHLQKKEMSSIMWVVYLPRQSCYSYCFCFACWYIYIMECESCDLWQFRAVTFNFKNISIYNILCSDNSLCNYGAPYFAKENNFWVHEKDPRCSLSMKCHK